MQSTYHLKNITSQTVPALGSTGFIRALPDDVRKNLLARGSVQSFAKGQLIQQRGDVGSEFWYVKAGTVQIGRFSLDGSLMLFALLGEGESFGEQAFLGDFPRMVDAIAGSDCTLIRIGEMELQSLIASDAAVARILLKTMAHMVQQVFDLVDAGRNLSTMQRLAQALYRLCGDEKRDISIAVTQQELADLVGVSRVSLGKALAALEMKGMAKRCYGAVIVCDREALYEF
jgi:CRP-like cAMP-binding protein